MSVSALDLPQVWQRPSFNELLACLKQLRVDPPVWNLKISRAEILREQDTTVQHRKEIAGYLSIIIKSNLEWIEDEDQKEQLWEEASKRLSERCGRAAMGEIVRRWPFEGTNHLPFDLTIREPSLTGDSLGLKTWGSSYVLALMLEGLASSSLAHLLSPAADNGPATVLELGSGTGLLGLAASCVWRTSVTLTDLPTIMPNLAHNVELNRSTVEKLGGSVDVDALTWGSAEDSAEHFQKHHQFEIVLAADPLYDDEHPALLSEAVDSQLSLGEGARALVMVPMRDETTTKLLDMLKTLLEAQTIPVTCIEENVVAGQDDWGEEDDVHQVPCWWGIFKRRH